MPRLRNTGRRFMFKDIEEIKAWHKYKHKCEEKGVKPMNNGDWTIQHRKLPNINLKNVRKRK